MGRIHTNVCCMTRAQPAHPRQPDPARPAAAYQGGVGCHTLSATSLCCCRCCCRCVCVCQGQVVQLTRPVVVHSTSRHGSWARARWVCSQRAGADDTTLPPEPSRKQNKTYNHNTKAWLTGQAGSTVPHHHTSMYMHCVGTALYCIVSTTRTTNIQINVCTDYQACLTVPDGLTAVVATSSDTHTHTCLPAPRTHLFQHTNPSTHVLSATHTYMVTFA